MTDFKFDSNTRERLFRSARPIGSPTKIRSFLDAAQSEISDFSASEDHQLLDVSDPTALRKKVEKAAKAVQDCVDQLGELPVDLASIRLFAGALRTKNAQAKKPEFMENLLEDLMLVEFHLKSTAYELSSRAKKKVHPSIRKLTTSLALEYIGHFEERPSVTDHLEHPSFWSQLMVTVMKEIDSAPHDVKDLTKQTLAEIDQFFPDQERLIALHNKKNSGKTIALRDLISSRP